jgi:hypothetical protein
VVCGDSEINHCACYHIIDFTMDYDMVIPVMLIPVMEDQILDMMIPVD